MPKPLLHSLRELDTQWQDAHLSNEADVRILAALQERQEKVSQETVALSLGAKSWAHSWWMGAAALGAVLFVVWFRWPISTVPEDWKLLHGKLLQTAQANPSEQRCDAKKCTLEQSQRGVRLVMPKATTWRKRPRKFRILGGKVYVSVQKRKRRYPVVIWVSHGRIEVIGTRFTIWQGSDQGHVTLHRGSIRFISLEGQVRTLQQGQQLRWPLILRPKSLGKRSVQGKQSVQKKRASKHKYVLKPTPLRVGLSRTKPMQARMIPRAIKSSKRINTKKVPPKVPPIERVSPSVFPGTPQNTQGSFHHRPTLKHPVTRTQRRLQRKVASVGRRTRKVSRRMVGSPRHQPRNAPSHRVHTSNGKRLSVRQLLQELEQWRSQGRYQHAVKQLRRYYSRFARRSTRERLHYEWGVLLTYHLRRRLQACKHWQTHQRLFASSLRYRREVTNIKQRLKCDSLLP